MKHVSIGGLDVSCIELGTMAMSGYYLDPDSSDAESIRTIQRALKLGVTHIDTAEIYGPYANEERVGRGHPEQRPRRRASTSRPEVPVGGTTTRPWKSDADVGSHRRRDPFERAARQNASARPGARSDRNTGR